MDQKFEPSAGQVNFSPGEGGSEINFHDKSVFQMNPLTQESVHRFAEQWIQSWNSHDLEEIMKHYDDGVILTSPIAAQLLQDPSGTVRGKENLRRYFQKGLEAYPDLKFILEDVTWGLHSMVLIYRNQKGTKAAEFMELGPSGKVSRVVANYRG